MRWLRVDRPRHGFLAVGAAWVWLRGYVASENLPEEIVPALRAALNGDRCLSQAMADALRKHARLA